VIKYIEVWGYSLMDKRYKWILTGIIIIMCIVTSLFFVYSINKVSKIYINQTKENVIQLKRSFLKDTVNNLIREIDAERRLQEEYYETLVIKQENIVLEKVNLPENEFNSFLIRYFESASDADDWYLLIWDRITNSEVYDSKNLISNQWNGTGQLNTELLTYHQIDVGDQIILYGISKKYIEEKVKNRVAEKIHLSIFDEESYIWVNEIINYNGGDNYAIRRVHPNLPDTEGSYLSTSMTDIKGNYPYKEELDGVKKSGELFFTYYFKKLNSDIVSEKLTYAKLYKDYNWVIAMGVHLDDVQSYIQITQAEDKKLTQRLTTFLVIFFTFILIFGFNIIILVAKWHNLHTKRVMESQINQDALTKACSRRCGSGDLLRSFREFKVQGESPAIMLFDIDHFKQVNDNYGHESGDYVLKEVVKQIYQILRSSDKLIRWGGDEFIVIVYGLKKENSISFGQEIISAVSNTKINVNNEDIKVTISIGITYFDIEDMEYLDTIRRADKALYEAKAAGRNCARSIIN
jgi:diguanylate cyclase (GGDEF)-like protein